MYYYKHKKYNEILVICGGQSHVDGVSNPSYMIYPNRKLISITTLLFLYKEVKLNIVCKLKMVG